MRTNPIKRAKELRKTLVQEDNLLVADFSDTLQGKDTSKVIDLMPNVKTGEYIFRTKVNVKAIDPIASGVYDTNFFDIIKHTDKEIENFIRSQEFDFPLWFKHNKGFKMERVLDYNPPLILQVAGCNFHDGSSSGGCMYCFVDNESNDGVIRKGKTFLSTSDVIHSAISARKKIKEQYKNIGTDLEIKVIRTSGGEPTIALDWILHLWRKIGWRGENFVGQLDSNLSTGEVVDYFEKEGVYERNILEKLAEYPIKVLTALKGVDKKNLQENVQSTATLEQQLYSIKKFIKAGFDIYPQMYNPNPLSLKDYLKKMDSEIENFSSRIHIGPLKLYSPTKKRLEEKANAEGQDFAYFLLNQQQEWDNNYKKGCEILDAYLRENQKHGYKEITRSDVVLKVKN